MKKNSRMISQKKAKKKLIILNYLIIKSKIKNIEILLEINLIRCVKKGKN